MSLFSLWTMCNSNFNRWQRDETCICHNNFYNLHVTEQISNYHNNFIQFQVLRRKKSIEFKMSHTLHSFIHLCENTQKSIEWKCIDILEFYSLINKWNVIFFHAFVNLTFFSCKFTDSSKTNKIYFFFLFF